MAVHPSPSKKHKSGAASRTTKSITDFENSLAIALKSNASLNPLNDLLHLAQSAETTDIALKCIFALYRTFSLIIRKGILSSSNNNDGGQELNEERRTVRSWVIVRLEAYTALLCSLLQDEEKTLRVRSHLNTRYTTQTSYTTNTYLLGPAILSKNSFFPPP